MAACEELMRESGGQTDGRTDGSAAHRLSESCSGV